MPQHYRQLTTGGVSLLKQLLKVFGEAFQAVATYQGAIPSDEYLRKLLSDENFIVLVALDDGVVVGGLVAYVLKKFERERSELYIYDLAVAEQYRRKGVATGLIKELQQIAKACGSYVLMVQADPSDDPAIKLYESLGKKEVVFHFDIRVD